LATIETGRQVVLLPGEADRLALPPDEGASLWVAAHPGAQRAGARSRLTQLVALDEHDAPVWAGALDETMLALGHEARSGVRDRLGACLLEGDGLWSVLFVRSLLVGNPQYPYLTIYWGARPWVVLGALPNGRQLAVPLNDAHGNPKWYTPVVERSDIRIPGSTKDAQLELAHLWSFEPGTRVIGQIAPRAREDLAFAVHRYFSHRP
jgi:hypothetical protein